MDKLGQIAGAYGDKVITGVGPHTGFKTRALICRVDKSVIAGLTINGVAVTTAALSNGNIGAELYFTELVTFAESEVITSITLTNATDSVRIIKCL